MKQHYLSSIAVLLSSVCGLLCGCKPNSADGPYVAYFGGEVENPSSNQVLFCKDNEVIDTLQLDCHNRFYKKFDSLAPGLYSFRHEPEYQYVYFDKNDSLMVHLNTNDFDNSIAFCGRGADKNNFLMEMYLHNEKDKNSMFEVFDCKQPQFEWTINKAFDCSRDLYKKYKQKLNWSAEFDRIAQASYLYQYYTKKELYPMVHQKRTGQDIRKQLPPAFYAFRKNINCNDEQLSSYSPYVMYLTHMLNNMGYEQVKAPKTEADEVLQTTIQKMKIADTLIKNNKVRALLFDHIAFTYLLEDQNMNNNHSFFEAFKKYAPDQVKKNDVWALGQSIQKLKPGLPLPDISLYNREGQQFHSKDLFKGKTVLFFWSKKSYSHLVAAHKKVADLQRKHPDYHFVAINLDHSHADFVQEIDKYHLNRIPEYRCANFDDVHIQWAITKVHRTLVIDDHQIIRNAFTNLFEVNFENNLH